MRKKRSRFVCCISNQLFDMWNLNLDLLNHWHGSSWLRGESSHQKNSSAEVFGLQPFDLRRRIDPGTEWDGPSLKNHWRRKILWIVSPNLRKHIVSDKFNIAMGSHGPFTHDLLIFIALKVLIFHVAPEGKSYNTILLVLYPTTSSTFPVNLDSIPITLHAR